VTPSQILDALRAAEERVRHAGARALLELFTELARGPLVEPSTLAVYLIPLAEREDMQQLAAYRFVARLRKPAPIFEASEDLDLSCTSYLRVVLVRAWLETARRRVREQPPDDGEMGDREPAPEDTRPDARLVREADRAEAAQRVGELTTILDRVAARVIGDTRGAEARANGEETWRQLRGLALEGAAMTDFLDRAAFSDPSAFARARGAIYSAHRRFRRAMALPSDDKSPSAIRRMLDDGELSSEEAQLAETAMVLLVRT
jgi:hypothetical protein